MNGAKSTGQLESWTIGEALTCCPRLGLGDRLRNRFEHECMDLRLYLGLQCRSRPPLPSTAEITMVDGLWPLTARARPGTRRGPVTAGSPKRARRDVPAITQAARAPVTAAAMDFGPVHTLQTNEFMPYILYHDIVIAITHVRRAPRRVQSPQEMASQTQGIQQLLAAEKRAAEKVSEARKRKAKRLKQAKEEAQDEVEKYRQERERQFKEFEAKHMGTREGVAAKIEAETKVKIEEMNRMVQSKKEQVIQDILSLVYEIKPELHINYRVQ
ncbi:V-type proton ATPase subunit G [Eumeta japonica]|uniref:V-type proton ATPase subunit G n=1 Tax=Eumeta variegata TaxID=151549 RepID=A0A4C1ZBZ5_EUMVA|nr:V-type proton ATPase subunit G [Eumeta japonica]